MATRIVKGGTRAAAKLAQLYWLSSNGAPIHLTVCSDGTCATVLAMVAAMGSKGVARLIRS